MALKSNLQFEPRLKNPQFLEGKKLRRPQDDKRTKDEKSMNVDRHFFFLDLKKKPQLLEETFKRHLARFCTIKSLLFEWELQRFYWQYPRICRC